MEDKDLAKGMSWRYFALAFDIVIAKTYFIKRDEHLIPPHHHQSLVTGVLGSAT